jgi:hypothetical protein
MGILKHIKAAMRTKSPQEKIEGQLRREHGVVNGHRNKHLDWDPENQKVHVLTSKKPFLAGILAGNRKHSEGLWHTKTFHWNDNHKLTHTQNWTDQDHWHNHEPPIRRIDGVHQENDRVDHMQESVIQFPGTYRFRKGDRVTHPSLKGVHVIYSQPDGKNAAIVHPEGHKPETDVAKDPTGFAGYKRVDLKGLKKV